MAYIYYPTTASLTTRTVSGSGYSEVNIGVAPNSIFVFDNTSITSSTLIITSASYAVTSSFALNGGTGGLGTGSTYPFTSSYAITASIASVGDLFVGTRSLSTTVNQATNLGYITIFAEALNLLISATVCDDGFSVAKSYLLVTQYPVGNYGDSNYRLVAPITSTGNFLGNDFELEATQNTTQLLLGIRRTGGSTAGNAHVRIVNLGPKSSGTWVTSFVPSTTVRASSNTDYWPSSILEQSALSASVIIHGALSGSNAWITSSHAVSASYAASGGSSGGLGTGSTYPFTASWAVSASYALNGGGGGLETGSTYSITSSFAISASYAATSSYATPATTISGSTTEEKLAEITLILQRFGLVSP